MTEPTVVVETTSTMKFGSSVNARQVKMWLDDVPDNAVSSVTKYPGDPRDPAQTTLTARYYKEEDRA